VFPKKMSLSQTALLRFEVLRGSLAPSGAPRLILGTLRHVASAPMCSQVHLKATSSVQSTLGFDQPGILVLELPNTPRGS